jgi:phosphate starvation-inducible protein PhoH
MVLPVEADVVIAPAVVVSVAKPKWRVPDMDIVEFTYKDVERHPVIKTILKLYKDLQ